MLHEIIDSDGMKRAVAIVSDFVATHLHTPIRAGYRILNLIATFLSPYHIQTDFQIRSKSFITRQLFLRCLFCHGNFAG